MITTLPERFVATEDRLDCGVLFSLRSANADECGRFGAPFVTVVEKDPTRMGQTRACFALLSAAPGLLTLARESLALLTKGTPKDADVAAHCDRLRAIIAEAEKAGRC